MSTRAAVDVGGRSVSYRRAGTGSRVLVVGPLDASTAQCADLLDVLAEHHEVLAVDPPGYGLSDPLPPGEVSVGDLADHVEGALAELGGGPAALVGQGLGGLVALELAVRSPVRH
ncbi:MAG TPA: alpha/beta fold hydrolase, partial [Mycobacteriales bacterium]|nr:alpha/beta fold hydrolase [Mycobacteriales bacterium]